MGSPGAFDLRWFLNERCSGNSGSIAIRLLEMIKLIKLFFKTMIVLAVLGGIGVAIYIPVSSAISTGSQPVWRTVKPEIGSVTRFVNATGSVKPVKSVQVGSFVSGPIAELYAEFNQEVKADELLAKIDARLIQANVDRDRASLEISKAGVHRVESQLQQARNDQTRALALKKRNKDFIAQSELDRVKFSLLALESQLISAQASVKQAEASLSNTLQNLEYTNIRSPEDGIIIDRKVEPGQTLAASFQTPELFVVGVGMREKMHVFANVDESEIGLIREAAKTKQPVWFRVDAYPKDLFDGTIEEVRFSSTETQNVVTYPVVVGAANPDLKLLPGMTANMAFQIVTAKDVLRIPKAAIRFFPMDAEHVHPDDREILEGKDEVKPVTANEILNVVDEESEERYVWIVDGEYLRAKKIRTGVSDALFVEVLSGDIDVNSELVTGDDASQ